MARERRRPGLACRRSAGAAGRRSGGRGPTGEERAGHEHLLAADGRVDAGDAVLVYTVRWPSRIRKAAWVGRELRGVRKRMPRAGGLRCTRWPSAELATGGPGADAEDEPAGDRRRGSEPRGGWPGTPPAGVGAFRRPGADGPVVAAGAGRGTVGVEPVGLRAGGWRLPTTFRRLRTASPRPCSASQTGKPRRAGSPGGGTWAGVGHCRNLLGAGSIFESEGRVVVRCIAPPIAQLRL
jgi:hypothetical protein